MNIIVCMKQVPATSTVEIDEETGSLKRIGSETRTNPYDLYALETALKIKENIGGKVTVITMGPPQTESMIRDAYSMGADDAIILSDIKFAGADVLATSYTLSEGIKALVSYDLILCGRQTTDGDTAQIGPALAQYLDIPHAAWISKIENVTKNSLEIEQIFSSTVQRSILNTPCLLTIEKDSCVPRLPSFLLKKKAYEKPISTFKFSDIEKLDSKYCGLDGSPTKVDAMFAPAVNAKKVMIEGNAKEQADLFVDILLKNKLIEKGAH